MKLVVVEDQQLYRETVIACCAREPDFEVVGEAADGISAMTVIRVTQPDVVLLDLELPGDSGFGVAEKIVRENLLTRCLFMSAHCNPVTLARVEKARVSGFIDKGQSGLSSLKQALLTIAQGGVYFSAAYQAALKQRNNDPRRFDRLLSPREQQVLKLIGAGHDNHDMASMLGLAFDTVTTHRKRLMGKLDIHDEAKLIRFAIDQGFTQFVALVCTLLVLPHLFDAFASIADWMDLIC